MRQFHIYKKAGMKATSLPLEIGTVRYKVSANSTNLGKKPERLGRQALIARKRNRRAFPALEAGKH